MNSNISGEFGLHDIKYHFAWTTFNRLKLFDAAIKLRAQDLIRQSCYSRGITILSGVINPTYVRLLLACPTSLSPGKIAQYIKGRTSQKLQAEYPSLRELCGGNHLWERGYFCETIGEASDEAVKDYLGIK